MALIPLKADGLKSILYTVDDWKNLEKVVDEIHPMTFVDFDRIAESLRAIGQKLGPE